MVLSIHHYLASLSHLFPSRPHTIFVFPPVLFQRTKLQIAFMNQCSFHPAFKLVSGDSIQFSMPGTIHVSVLGFEALHSSPTSSLVSVKISIGKREFQTLGIGDFAFPLTSLRDKLVVTLENADGNVISRAVIETKKVVEKRVWDGNFFLDEGGFVHMKLQFVLSEEERNRIRDIRESALKKKHDERCNMPVPAFVRFEVQDEKGSLSSTRTSAASSVMDDPPADSDARNSVEMPTSGGSSMSANSAIPSSSIATADDMNQNEVNRIRKVGVADGSYSSVKKMINAFESNQIQVSKPTEKPPPIKYQIRKIEAGFPLETSSCTHFSTGERILAAKPTIGRTQEELQQIKAAKTQECERSSLLKSFNEDVPSQGTENLLSSSRLVHQVVEGGLNLTYQEITEGTLVNSLQMQDTADYKLESGFSFPRDHCFRGHSGLWIFPNEAASSCATTSVKGVICTSAGSHDTEKSNQDVKTQKPEQEVNSDDHRDPYGQVMKIAIMIGFATLVLLTRRRQ